VAASNFSMGGFPVLQASEFRQISGLAYEHFGLDLSNGKEGLVAARLGKKLRELKLPSFQAYLDYVKADRTGDALTSMVDLLTTNHTSFFREAKHFDFLRSTVLPQLEGRPTIDIWSAACSTGEEPYSIAMSLLEEAGPTALAKVRIKATDISTRVLETGRQGVYPEARFGDVPDALMRKYLLRGQRGSAGCFRFKDEVRSMIQFEHLNLMTKLPEGYKCSALFCRNIMIYFDKPTQQNLVARLSEHIEDGGYFFVGHSESLNGISHQLEFVAPATYRKVAKSSSRTERMHLVRQIGRR